MKDSIILLQEALLHQGEEIQHLSHELYTQQKEIARLQNTMALLQLQFKTALSGDSEIRPLDQETPPPHY